MILHQRLMHKFRIRAVQHEEWRNGTDWQQQQISKRKRGEPAVGQEWKRIWPRYLFRHVRGKSNEEEITPKETQQQKREEILWGEQSISWCVAQLDIGFQCTPTSPYPLLTVFDATLLIIRPLVIYPRSNILLSAFPVSVFNHRWLRTINKHRVLWYERYQSRFNFPALIRFCNVHAQLTGVPSDFLWSYDPLAHGLDGRRLNSSYTFREGKVIEKKDPHWTSLLIKDSFLRKKQFPRASQWEVHRNEVERILTAHEVGRVMSGRTHSFGFCVSGVENVRKWDWIFSNWCTLGEAAWVGGRVVFSFSCVCVCVWTCVVQLGLMLFFSVCVSRLSSNFDCESTRR